MTYLSTSKNKNDLIFGDAISLLNISVSKTAHFDIKSSGTWPVIWVFTKKTAFNSYTTILIVMYVYFKKQTHNLNFEQKSRGIWSRDPPIENSIKTLAMVFH